MNENLVLDALPSHRLEILELIGSEKGTPSYVYFIDSMLSAIEEVKSVFEGRFSISFAVKSNPNVELLRHLRGFVGTLDISSIESFEEVSGRAIRVRK